MLLLILGALMLTRHLLWEDRTEPLTAENASNRSPEPLVLPGIVKPETPEKGGAEAIPAGEPSGPQREAPRPLEASVLEQEKVRVLPPIQAEPDEEETMESPFQIEPEPIVEDPTEDEAPPIADPEPGPDFVR